MADHGTNSRYANGGCRCDPCRAANKAYRDSRKIASTGGGFDVRA